MTQSALSLLVSGNGWASFVSEQPDVQADETRVGCLQGDSRTLWTLINVLLGTYEEVGRNAAANLFEARRSGSRSCLASGLEFLKEYNSLGQFLSALEDLLYRRLACERGLSHDLHFAVRNSDGHLEVVTYTCPHRKPGDVMVFPDPALCGI